MADKNREEWEELKTRFSKQLISSNQETAIIATDGFNIIIDRLQPLKNDDPRYLVTIGEDGIFPHLVYGFGRIINDVEFRLALGRDSYKFPNINRED